MKDKKNKKKLVVRKGVFRLIFFGGVSLVLIVYFFVMVTNLWINIKRKYDEKKECAKELTRLREKEEILQSDVLKLQDPEYVARYLREKFFYSKNDEYVIKIPD